MKLILYVSAIIAFTISLLYLWKEGRFSTAELISLIAVIISVAIGGFTFLINSLPPNISMESYNLTLSKLPEINKENLISESLLLDVYQGITDEGKKIKAEILNKLGLKDLPQDKNELINRLRNVQIQYNPTQDVIKHFIGKSPVSIPVVLGLTFVNETGRQTVIKEILLELITEDRRIICRPYYTVNSSKFFRFDFQKTRDFIEEAFHPFVINSKTEISQYYYFGKDKAYDKNKKENQSLELSPGKYKFVIHFKYGNYSRSVNIRELDISEKLILDLAAGGNAIMMEASELMEDISTKSE